MEPWKGLSATIIIAQSFTRIMGSSAGNVYSTIVAVVSCSITLWILVEGGRISYGGQAPTAPPLPLAPALKPRLSLWRCAANTYTGDFPDVKLRLCARLQSSVVYTISEKSIRFRHPDYDPDRAQELISSSMSRHLSTSNISSKFIHAFLSNLANRQTDKQTGKTCTSSFVEGVNKT